VGQPGLPPSIYFSDDPEADLEAYAGACLQQENVAEGVTRNIPAFSRFLKVAALCNCRIVNFTNISNNAQVARTTVYEITSIKYTQNNQTRITTCHVNWFWIT